METDSPMGIEHADSTDTFYGTVPALKELHISHHKLGDARRYSIVMQEYNFLVYAARYQLCAMLKCTFFRWYLYAFY